MAAFYFTKLASRSEENSFHPDIFCHVCGLNSTPRPELATASTRFTCRHCCDLFLKSRDRETADAFAVKSAQIDRTYWQETTSVGPLQVTNG
jgi:hypothetical protein